MCLLLFCSLLHDPFATHMQLCFLLSAHLLQTFRMGSFCSRRTPCSSPVFLYSLSAAKLELYRQYVEELALRAPQPAPPVYCVKPAPKASVPASLMAGALAAVASGK